MRDGVHVIQRIHARAAMIKVLDKPHLDLTTPVSRDFIAFLSALAKDERQRIVKRANDGRAAARKRGLHVGRKPKLTELHNVASLASALPRARGSEPFGNYAGSAIDVVAEFGVLVQLPAATA
jgi:DNA invertase Pin-like site-specific DNA recombinase